MTSNNYSAWLQLTQQKRQAINQQLISLGVIILDPETTYIMPDIVIGADTVIYPNSYIIGQTVIGSHSIIGPQTFINSSSIGDHCIIRFSLIEEAIVENYVDVGPFAHLRKGAHLAEHVHIGNFGEIKNSYLGRGAKMGHFSYLGDATIGENVNIGAGTITCNYDGQQKHPTVVGDNSFIGSDTMLVAPLNLGANSRTGAGSVVVHDVPDNSLVYGVPARSNSSIDED